MMSLDNLNACGFHDYPKTIPPEWKAINKCESKWWKTSIFTKIWCYFIGKLYKTRIIIILLFAMTKCICCV